MSKPSFEAEHRQSQADPEGGVRTALTIMDDTPKLQVRLVGRDGRRRYDPVSRDQLVAACSEPGVWVSRLAREYGVNANLVRKWISDAPVAPMSLKAAGVLLLLGCLASPLRGNPSLNLCLGSFECDF